MKTSLLIIATALFSGTVSAQTETNAGHNSSTTVSVDARNVKASVANNQETSVTTSNGSSVKSQSSGQAGIDASPAVAKVNSTATATRSRVKATAATTSARAAAATSASASAAANASVKTTNTAIHVTKMSTARVKAAAPKPHVRVISSSALSIKR